MDPSTALRQIAFQLNRTPTELPGIGPATVTAIIEAAAGQQPEYLGKLLANAPQAEPHAGLRAALRGDCHTHSDWSECGNCVAA